MISWNGKDWCIIALVRLIELGEIVFGLAIIIDNISQVRAFPNSQKTLFQEYSSLLKIPNARGFFQGKRGTTSPTKGTASAHKALAIGTVVTSTCRGLRKNFKGSTMILSMWLL